MLINKANLAVVHVASKEDNNGRYSLNNIQISTKGTIATNAAIAACVSLPPAKDEDFPLVLGVEALQANDPLYLEQKAALEVKKGIKKSSLQHVYIGQNGDKTPVAVITDLDNHRQFRMTNINVAFPDVMESCQPKEASKYEIAINAELLKQLVEVAKDFFMGASEQVLHFHFYGESRDDHTPVVVTAKNGEGQELRVLMMPIRWEPKQQ